MNFIKKVSRAVEYKKDEVNLAPRFLILTYDDGTEVRIYESFHIELFKLCCKTFGIRTYFHDEEVPNGTALNVL